MSEPAPPAPPAGSRLVRALIGGLVLVAVVVAVLLFTVVKPAPDETPAGVARDFVARLRDGQYDRARDLLCDSGKHQVADGNALRTQLGFDPTAITDFSVGDPVHVDGGTDIAVDLRGVPSRATLTLDVVGEHGRQAVCGIA